MMTALGIYRAARSLGLNIGKDLSVIAHDDDISFLSAENMVPALTATRSSMRQAGKRCASMLMDILDKKVPNTCCELWTPELILRDSTTRAPQ
jgi:LacI family transcriptional regulator